MSILYKLPKIASKNIQFEQRLNRILFSPWFDNRIWFGDNWAAFKGAVIANVLPWTLYQLTSSNSSRVQGKTLASNLHFWTQPRTLAINLHFWTLPRLCISYREQYITKTCLYNFLRPSTPSFYSKTGIYRGIQYFSYFCSKIQIVGTR